MRRQTNIFVAGSRHISRLSKAAQKRLDNMVDQDFTILVGDANGVDKAVQQYLSDRHYERVIVFCMDGLCRNNLGEWPTRAIAAPEQTRRDFSYYSTKDKAMVEEAHYGLMLWDGKSRGTLRSILDLVHHKKGVVVYIAPEKSFFTISGEKDLASILCRYNASKFNDFDERVSLGMSESHKRKGARTPSAIDGDILSRNDGHTLPSASTKTEEIAAFRPSTSSEFLSAQGAAYPHMTKVTFKRAPRDRTPQPEQLVLATLPAKPVKRRKRRSR